MLPFGVTIPVTVPQKSEIPEGLMNNPVYSQHNRLITEQLANDINPLYEQAYPPRALQNTPWQGFTQEGTPLTYTDG